MGETLYGQAGFEHRLFEGFPRTEMVLHAGVTRVVPFFECQDDNGDVCLEARFDKVRPTVDGPFVVCGGGILLPTWVDLDRFVAALRTVLLGWRKDVTALARRQQPDAHVARVDGYLAWIWSLPRAGWAACMEGVSPSGKVDVERVAAYDPDAGKADDPVARLIASLWDRQQKQQLDAASKLCFVLALHHALQNSLDDIELEQLYPQHRLFPTQPPGFGPTRLSAQRKQRLADARQAYEDARRAAAANRLAQARESLHTACFWYEGSDARAPLAAVYKLSADVWRRKGDPDRAQADELWAGALLGKGGRPKGRGSKARTSRSRRAG